MTPIPTVPEDKNVLDGRIVRDGVVIDGGTPSGKAGTPSDKDILNGGRP